LLLVIQGVFCLFQLTMLLVELFQFSILVLSWEVDNNMYEKVMSFSLTTLTAEFLNSYGTK